MRVSLGTTNNRESDVKQVLLIAFISLLVAGWKLYSIYNRIIYHFMRLHK